jgi:hypothetical protein
MPLAPVPAQGQDVVVGINVPYLNDLPVNNANASRRRPSKLGQHFARKQLESGRMTEPHKNPRVAFRSQYNPRGVKP